MDIATQMLEEDAGCPVSPTIIIPGTQLITKGLYVFICPVCQKTFRYNDSYAPICTGPSENQDVHPPQLMNLDRVEPKKVIA